MEPFLPNWVSKPGESVEDLMQEQGHTVTDLADRSGLSVETVAGILDATVEIGPTEAEGLAKAYGLSAKFWLERERQYRADCERLGLH